MAKIGIMGGTFNPIHNGHLHIAGSAYREYGLDQIHFMPNHIPAYKSRAEMVSATDRIQMVALAIADYPEYVLNTMEIDRGGKTYTADTLRILKEQENGDQYYFILGADSLETFTRWYHPREIVDYAEILVASREKADTKALTEMIRHTEETLQISGRFHIIHCNSIEEDAKTAFIASSQIRKCIALNLAEEPVSGLPITELIPEAVFQYIKKHELYED